MNKGNSIKLRAIGVRNYKGIDSLSVDFPMPVLPEDPDITVMGSSNGVCKTSLLECCALVLMSLCTKDDVLKLVNKYRLPVDIPGIFVSAGGGMAEITGDVVVNGNNVQIKISISDDGMMHITGPRPYIRHHGRLPIAADSAADGYVYDPVHNLIRAMCGLLVNPVIEKPYLFFHGARRVQEGNINMRTMVLDDAGFSYDSTIVSDFKMLVVRLLMNEAEQLHDNELGKIIAKLNQIIRFYAGGTIGKLDFFDGNGINLKVKLDKQDKSVYFDALGSGQKEIISMLFLVWYYGKDNPCVVLIDEPELHLNAEWHKGVVRNMLHWMPQNQYILATNSVGIVDDVDKGRRMLFVQENGKAGD